MRWLRREPPPPVINVPKDALHKLEAQERRTQEHERELAEARREVFRARIRMLEIDRDTIGR
jgi:hypothetical protein